MSEWALPSQLSYWNDWHRTRRYIESGPERDALPEAFLKHLPDMEPRVVLDLGCGRGDDALRFGREGLSVHALDFSATALEMARRSVVAVPEISVEFYDHDMGRGLPFDDGQFVGVYSHLSLHYFDDRVTKKIFFEISRVTRSEGVVALSVKSTADSYYGEGTHIGDDMYCRKGHVRHFFGREYLSRLMQDWNLINLEDYTGRYADGRLSAFIRAIALKP